VTEEGMQSHLRFAHYYYAGCYDSIGKCGILHIPTNLALYSAE
jgi:hypothetical protein